jgi:hypothetical protein
MIEIPPKLRIKIAYDFLNRILLNEEKDIDIIIDEMVSEHKPVFNEIDYNKLNSLEKFLNDLADFLTE